MKYVIIGDLHLRCNWKQIIQEENTDKFIFLGDYLSPHGFRPSKLETVESFMNEVLEFKESNPEKVILLRGNHDLNDCGYYWADCFPNDYWSRKYLSSIKDRFLKDSQWIYKIPDTNIVCSHAGIGQYFLEQCMNKLGIEDYNLSIIERINELEPSEIFGFNSETIFDATGTSETQPCTWIRPYTLLNHGVKDIIQIVGHTPVVKDIVCLDDCIWLCDSLDLGKYLVIDNNKFVIKTLWTNVKDTTTS
jgi:predicted phosphodiesterase